MRTLPIFASLLGGAAVYLVFAACGSGESRGRSRLGDSSTGGNAMTSSTVPDARAQGSADPETATEPCNKKFASPVIGGDVVYAEHLFLGRTAAQLARLVAIGHIPGGALIVPSTYQLEATAVFIQDGKAAVNCAVGGSPTFDTVAFILPE